MRRRVVAIVGVVALLLAAIPAVAASIGGPSRLHGDRTLTVVEHADTDTVIDLGPTGDSLGDLLPFGNPIFDRKDQHQVGRDEGQCVRTNPGLAWECTWTTILPAGSISVEGPFYDDGRDSKLAVTGGTGVYRNARGEMTLHFRNPAGTAFDFIFRLIGD